MVTGDRYMYEGGTNFGFMNGANYEGFGTYQATVTSYDYDGCLTEWGDPTEKYLAIKKVKNLGTISEE